MANKPTQPIFPLGLETAEQSKLAGILNTGIIEHGPDAVMTVPEGDAVDGLPSSVRYNSASDEFEGYYENGGWLPLGGGGVRWEVLPHASTATLQEGRGYLVDNSSDVSTVVFPTPTRVGDSVTVCDLYGKFSVYPLTIDPNGHSIYGSTEPMTLSTDSVSATFTWSGDARGWIVTAGVGLGQGRVYSRTIFTTTLASDTSQVTLVSQPSIVDVYVDGKRLPESKYSLDGYNVNFSPALSSGSEVQIIQYVPIQLGAGGGGSSSTVITWVYNSGSATGGETTITLDVDAEDVSELFINGTRQQKNLGFQYDSNTKVVTLADELDAGDEVVVVINGDPTLYNQIDRTPNEVARAANVPVSQVILGSDTITKLNGKTVIYDVAAQKSWGLPAGIPTTASVVSISGNQLTYAVGSTNTTVTLVDVAGSAPELRGQLASLVGSDLVGYKKPATGAVLHAVSKRFQKVYDAVADYGADPTGQVDSYAALQAWADACVADNWATAQINGIFKISQPILFHNILGLTIVADCYIYPTYDTGDYVVGWCNGQGVRTVGRMEVSGQSKIGIKTGHKIWSDTSQGFSFSYFYGLNASDVLCGIQVGDTAYPDALLSEMSFIGGFTVGTPCAIRTIGTQCYINFNNFDAVSGSPGGLSAVTQYTIHNIGAQVKFIGGEIQHNNNILGAAVLMQPIVSATYGNQVGCFESVSSHIENQATLALIYNIDGVANPVTKKSVVSFVGSHGFHNQDNGGLIVVHDTIKPVFEGTIITRDIGFYTTTTTRTQPNIVAGPKTIVDYDPKGFGPGFVKGLQAVSGGILLFKRRVIYCARNTNGQSVGTSNTVLVYSEPQASDDFYRWVTNYSAGRFTVPAGGLKNVEVNANLRVASGNVQLDVYVDSTLKTLSSPASSINSVHVYLGDLNEGQIIDVRGTASAATTTNGGGLEFMTITAER